MFHKPIDEMFPNPPAGLDAHALREDAVPQHVAVIMDGNGRWAKKRALNRLKGHKAGIAAVRELIRAASDAGVRFLTIYSFSTENWKRPEEEVVGLMDLFAKTMLAEVDGLHAENVRTRTLLVAVNYGSRQEMLRATQRCIDVAVARAMAGDVPHELTEEEFGRGLYTADCPDPDLVIRTSGEMRLSNFLLWQVAYSEFYVTDTLWPDFDRYEFLRALLSFQERNRRFGAV